MGHGSSVMLEQHYYWALIYDRWIGGNWPRTKRAYFGNLPLPVREVVSRVVQHRMREELMGQGMGRFAPEQILTSPIRTCAPSLTSSRIVPFSWGIRPPC